MNVRKLTGRLRGMMRLLESPLAEDKLRHIMVSAIITVALNLFLSWWMAAILTIGIGKEVYDK